MSSPRVAICNVFDDSNRGGCAITIMTARFVRRLYPEAKLALFKVRSGDTDKSHYISSELIADATFKDPPLPSGGPLRTVGGVLLGMVAFAFPRVAGKTRRFSALAECRLVVGKGGYLFGHRTGPSSALGLLFASYPLVYASRLGIPTIAYSVSIGPFSSAWMARLTGSLLKRIDLIMARDEESRRTAEELGVPSARVTTMPDCVFGWEQLAVRDRGDEVRVALVLRDVEGFASDLQAITEACLELTRAGEIQGVDVIVQDCSDLRVSAGAVAQLREHGLKSHIRGDAAASPDELIAIYSEYTLTMSHRLHGSIFSLLGGTPSVVLSVDPAKAEGVLDTVGLAHVVVDRASVSSGLLVARMRNLLANNAVGRVRGAVETAAADVGAASGYAQRMLAAIPMLATGQDEPSDNDH